MSVFTVPDADWLTHWGIDPGDEVFDQEAETVDGYVSSDVIMIRRARLALWLFIGSFALVTLLTVIA